MGNPRRPAAGAAATQASSKREVGFAKLQGECFEYYMQNYSIIIGRSSRRSSKDPAAAQPPEADEGVDLDLGVLGGGMNVSRRHARIFYDFDLQRFQLEVLGKNGCLVEGVHHFPRSPYIKLDSQDLQMGDTKFYFLLPSRSVYGASVAVPSAIRPPPSDDDEDEGEQGEDMAAAAKRLRNGYSGRRSGTGGSNAYREADDRLLLQLEEKDVISSAATILSDLCGPNELVSMNTLHEVMLYKYGNLWHHSRVRKYLTSEDFLESETDGRPWHGLALLLRKYPEHFVVNIRNAGGPSIEIVSLVSLQP
ncbi:hypothetical protein HU200_038557 [Digitaria exilis]|uniref:FHA domain-containing protein n=1 Tax=Digitaria exilis TaxID=1010633 RepID=A0A835BBP2_9POAL|nr:hypothetical protein HU200_038557 [Digitaria exilis]